MATSAERLLLDTSAAIAVVRPDQDGHTAALTVVRGRTLGLAGHAAVETYSVLTRLPAPQRLTARAAVRLITTVFPASHHLTAARSAVLLAEFCTLGLTGGAVYDGLVAAAAVEAELPLLSLDRRAEPVYRALGVDLRLLWAPFAARSTRRRAPPPPVSVVGRVETVG